LIRLASSHADRLMLNAGRGNPNFLATAPRHGFFQCGLFAMSEAEGSSACMPEGVGGLPQPEGIAERFQIFVQARRATPGVAFLVAAVSYAREWLGFSDGDFLQELVEGVLGCNYPTPCERSGLRKKIVRHFLRKEMSRGASAERGNRPFRGRGRHRRDNIHLQLAARADLFRAQSFVPRRARAQ
jgi:aspartate 4-decarboxylase